MGEVVSIHRVRHRHGETEALECVQVQTNYGLEGDWRSRRNYPGQLTVIEAEVLEDVARRLGRPIAPGASRRQIVVRGMRLQGMIGRYLRLGPVRVCVEEPCDPCVRMETTVGAGAQAALESRGGVRCRVVEGGELRTGDRVTEEAPQSAPVEPAPPMAR